MNRRDSLKTLVLGTVGGGLAITGCNPATTAEEAATIADASEHFYGRTPKEIERDELINSKTFFNEHELATITVLANLIMPPSQHGGIVEAKVPEFIEFIVKDLPYYQTTVRGGLAWLEHKSNTDFQLDFVSLTEDQQKQILDTIAYYDHTVPEAERPVEVRWFNTMRNLVTTGYFTSEVGVKDLGYVGNVPNSWDGVPDHVLKAHGVEYDPEWIAKCIDHSKAHIVAEWDDKGNLLT